LRTRLITTNARCAALGVRTSPTCRARPSVLGRAARERCGRPFAAGAQRVAAGAQRVGAS
jgi:hypothetical protein